MLVRLVYTRFRVPIVRHFAADAGLDDLVGKKKTRALFDSEGNVVDQNSVGEAFRRLDMAMNWNAIYHFLGSPPLPDTRTEEEKKEDDEIDRVFGIKMTERIKAEEAMYNNLIRNQHEAIAALPDDLRKEALIFDPILPPPHPRMLMPRRSPVLSDPKLVSPPVLDDIEVDEIDLDEKDDDDDVVEKIPKKL